MNFLTKLFFLATLLSSSLLFGQDDYSNQDWKALNSYLNKDYSTSISQCRSLLKKQPEGVAKNRTQFILARGLMEVGKYKEAIKILSKTHLNAAFLKSAIPGLIGDCKVEQGKYTEALEFYSKAFHAEWNEGTTPRYLYKAYLCAEKLGRIEEGQQFIQTIQFYFPSYAGQHLTQKYVIDDSIQYIKLTVPTATQPAELGIGTINGKQVSIDQFYEAYGIAEMNAAQQAQQQGERPQPVDENRVWASFVAEELRRAQYAILKLHSDDEEFMAYLMATDGFDPQSEFLNSPAFTYENGSFAPKKLLARIDEMRFAENEDQVEAWANTKEYYMRKLIQEKHQNFVALSLFTNTLQVNQHIEEEQHYHLNYRIEFFRNIPDSTIPVTSDELKTFYTSQKKTQAYQQPEDQHELVYINTTVKPNSKDTSDLYFKLEALKRAFQKSKDDSLFVVSVQSNLLKFYTSGPYSTAVPVDHKEADYGKYITFPAGLSSAYDSANLGDVIGPYEFNNCFVIAKVIGRTDEKIEARHILINMDYQREGAEEEAQAFLKTVTNENFAELAAKHSQDTGSAHKGGDLGTFFFGDMVPPFATYCADAPIGEIGLVLTQFGYHIVQVTKRSGKRFPRLAVVQIPFQISDEASRVAKDKLEEIREMYVARRKEAPNDDPKILFNSITVAKDEFARLSKIPTNSPQFYGPYSETLKDSMLRFGFNPKTKEGDISEIFIDSNEMILAVFSQKLKAGPKQVESALDQLTADLIKHKKAEILLNRIQNETTSEGEDLTLKSFTSLATPQLIGGGFEPLVVGQAIRAYHKGQNGIYVKGYAGVYFVEVLSKEESTDPPNIEKLRDHMNQAQSRQFYEGFERQLVQSNVVIDNRALYRLRVRN